MRHFLATILFCISSSANAKFRLIDLKKEIEKSSFVGEVIVTGYDSVKVSTYSKFYQRVLKDSLTGNEYADTNYVDSTYILYKVNFRNKNTGELISAKVYSAYSWITYRQRPDTLPGRTPSLGYWPKIGDTCLVILDENSFVSVFALTQNDNFIFWDPYWNSSWNTIFIFDSPFKKYPAKSTFKADSFAMNRAKENQREAYSYYHCSVDKKTFLALINKDRQN